MKFKSGDIVKIVNTNQFFDKWDNCTFVEYRKGLWESEESVGVILNPNKEKLSFYTKNLKLIKGKDTNNHPLTKIFV